MLNDGNKPLISIIVPAYNSEASICRCVESILQQTFENLELIIINDGSTDNTEELCLKYTNDSRVRLINKQNGGVSSARNRGIEEAAADYIIFADSDDYFVPTTCEILINAMMKNQSDFCLAGFNLMIEGNQVAEFIPSSGIQNRSYTINDLKDVFGYIYISNLFNSPWAKCYKKALIQSEFNANYSLGEDLLFNLEYLKNCKSIYVSDKPVYNYCFLQSNSLSNKFSLGSFDAIRNVYLLTGELIKGLWGTEAWPMSAIEKKYISDFVTLIDRWIRVKRPNAENIKEIIDKYHLKENFAGETIDDMSKKNEIERRMILKDKLVILKFIAVFSDKLKRKRD